MKTLQKSNRPVVNHANGFDSRVWGCRPLIQYCSSPYPFRCVSNPCLQALLHHKTQVFSQWKAVLEASLSFLSPSLPCTVFVFEENSRSWHLRFGSQRKCHLVLQNYSKRPWPYFVRGVLDRKGAEPFRLVKLKGLDRTHWLVTLPKSQTLLVQSRTSEPYGRPQSGNFWRWKWPPRNDDAAKVTAHHFLRSADGLFVLEMGLLANAKTGRKSFAAGDMSQGDCRSSAVTKGKDGSRATSSDPWEAQTSQMDDRRELFRTVWNTLWVSPEQRNRPRIEDLLEFFWTLSDFFREKESRQPV